ncbi:MAG TPA: arginine deiminase-related protein [Chitinophagaceae bacterium]|nr:arginine deiminase-related protein [Chitinophagaceae bacterium]
MDKQTTAHLLMIRPVAFTFNEETAVNNAFQAAGHAADAQQKALQEFDAFVALLRKNGVDVTVIEDTPEPATPDSIFPNNWISFHSNGSIVLYPMYARNRRLERKPTVLAALEAEFGKQRIIDLTAHEAENVFLEGTGSMVLDRENKIAYACLSPRTDYFVLTEFCEQMGYSPLVFDAVDQQGQPIYHTNVLMCVASKYVVICLEAIPAQHEREEVQQSIRNSGKEIVDISYDQMNHFAGNMLQVSSSSGEPLLVMSSQAFQSLSAAQKEKLSGYNRIIHSPLTTIETNGGGSARCMMAEIHLPAQVL